jgi:hypothetical protein
MVEINGAEPHQQAGLFQVRRWSHAVSALRPAVMGFADAVNPVWTPSFAHL